MRGLGSSFQKKISPFYPRLVCVGEPSLVVPLFGGVCFPFLFFPPLFVIDALLSCLCRYTAFVTNTKVFRGVSTLIRVNHIASIVDKCQTLPWVYGGERCVHLTNGCTKREVGSDGGGACLHPRTVCAVIHFFPFLFSHFLIPFFLC